MSANRKRKLCVFESPNEDRINEFIKHSRRSIDKPEDNKTLLDETKIFNDAVHGHISLPTILCSIIDTPQFQRLRRLKQLGYCYLVFPCASHNRFEHSIGTAYLAGRMCRTLQKQQPDLRILKKDRLCVQIAGLCHDLGHGPFSHFFDGVFVPRVNPNSQWKHEQSSVAMFEHLMQENSLYERFREVGLDETDFTFIKELINGPLETNSSQEWEYRGRPKEKAYLYQIVANKVTGIDVDKWDYFARDCYHLGISNNFDYRRFMKFARVVEVDGKHQICTRDKEVSTLYDMFHTRNSLHRRAYQHKTAKILEIMFCDVFTKANDFLLFPGKDSKRLKMSEAINDMNAFELLTDDVISMIQTSSDERLNEAKELIKRIHKRNLYKIIGHTILPKYFENKPLNDIRNDILQKIDFDVNPDEFAIQITRFDYGMREQNPIDKVRFYDKNQPNVAIMLKRNQISQMLPEAFAEKHLRMIYKSNDQDIIEHAKTAFQSWCHSMKFKKSYTDTNPELTPVKKYSSSSISSANSDTD